VVVIPCRLLSSEIEEEDEAEEEEEEEEEDDDDDEVELLGAGVSFFVGLKNPSILGASREGGG
jgi:hypothetical protein